MNTDINIEGYSDIKQCKNYPLLKSIKVIRVGKVQNPYAYDVEVILASKNDDELLLLFQEVFNIKINPIDGIFDSDIAIMNISKAQIENATYFVSGNEDEIFSFHCKSFIFYKGT